MEKIQSRGNRLMESNKIQITKKLVIDTYKSAVFYRYFATTLFCVIYISAFILWYDNLLKIIPFAFAMKELIILFIILPVSCLICIVELIMMIVEITRVLKGNFFITTDKIIERQATRKKMRVDSFNYRRLKFEKYGNYYVHKEYLPFKKKFVSAREQLNEAYLGDVYYVAVTNKNKRIIAVLNTKIYYHKNYSDTKTNNSTTPF